MFTVYNILDHTLAETRNVFFFKNKTHKEQYFHAMDLVNKPMIHRTVQLPCQQTLWRNGTTYKESIISDS